MKPLLNNLKSYAQTPGPRAKILLGIAALIALLLLSWAIALLIRPDTAADVSSTEISQPQATHQVSITKDGFAPATLQVKKGTKIIWTNTDDKPHQLQANPHPTGDSLPGLKSEILNNQQIYSYTANTAGTFGYHDHLNPTTNGTIDVRE